MAGFVSDTIGPFKYAKRNGARVARHTVLLRTLIFIVREERVLLIRYTKANSETSGEKSDRAGIYNGIGGHVEVGEDIIASAAREAIEEAGVTLESPRVAGIMHIDGFAGKQMVNFIIVASTTDEPLTECDEGILEWVAFDRVSDIRTFSDVKPLLARAVENPTLFTGTARFEGFELLELRLDGEFIGVG
jgi:8-oxo-dGTP diphosphatase